MNRSAELPRQSVRIRELEESLRELVDAVYCLRWEDRKRETEAVVDRARTLLGLERKSRPFFDKIGHDFGGQRYNGQDAEICLIDRLAYDKLEAEIPPRKNPQTMETYYGLPFEIIDDDRAMYDRAAELKKQGKRFIIVVK